MCHDFFVFFKLQFLHKIIAIINYTKILNLSRINLISVCFSHKIFKEVNKYTQLLYLNVDVILSVLLQKIILTRIGNTIYKLVWTRVILVSELKKIVIKSTVISEWLWLFARLLLHFSVCCSTTVCLEILKFWWNRDN